MLYERMDREQARLAGEAPASHDRELLVGLSGEKRAVAIGVWLADTAANANGNVSDEQVAADPRQARREA